MVASPSPRTMMSSSGHSASDSWSKVTQKLSLAWTPWDGMMLYATHSEGYKSGAFQSQTNLPSTAAQPVESMARDCSSSGEPSQSKS